MPGETRIGMLWGDFPWHDRARKVGRLLSMGAVGCTTTRALGACGWVVPYSPPPANAAAELHRAALESFLRRIDVQFGDVYAGTRAALELRRELGMDCPAVLFEGGAMPKGADAMLSPVAAPAARGRRHLVHLAGGPGDLAPPGVAERAARVGGAARRRRGALPAT